MEQEQVEERIINEAKRIMEETGKGCKTAILRAIHLLGILKEVQEICSLFDITLYDYAKYIEEKIGDIK